jgi:exportin-5
MRSIVGRVLSDRFWQAGISEGSKDDFYARVMDKKGTLEGLASSIRGSVRFIRETTYAIIYCMSRMDMQFYGFSELPGPLAHALFADSFNLSTHQQINLLNLVRYLVNDCPVETREHFLPPMLAACFQQVDTKIRSEWEQLDQQQTETTAGEDLTEEMKAESILRQVTYTAVLMMADFLDPIKPSKKEDIYSPTMTDFHADPAPLRPEIDPETGAARKYPSLRRFCLTQSSIVEPLLVFCTHAIRWRDSRCCNVVLRVFRSIVPDFHFTEETALKSQDAADAVAAAAGDAYLDTSPISPSEAHAIREYISSDVLRACISSLHEPYFVDLQKELASLIAAIIVYYSPSTNTPREVLLSLPNVKAPDVDRLNEYISKPGAHSRQQRALVLDLLKDLKGVSIAEMGKIPKSAAGFGNNYKKGGRSKMAQEFMSESAPGGPGGAANGNGGAGPRSTPEGLEGVAGLFDV